jgi:hypothetical protein
MTEYDVIGGEFVNELVLRRKGSDGINDDYIYTYDDNRLLVETNLVWVVSGFFNIPEEDTLDYIGEWFENKYNLPVEEIIDWL